MDLYDLRQNQKIAGAQGTAERAGAKADQFGEQLRSLERRVAKLIAINEALWQLLREAGSMSEEHLTTRVEAIEAKFENQSRAVSTCPKCSRPTAAKHIKCMYCGTELPKGSIFDQLF